MFRRLFGARHPRRSTEAQARTAELAGDFVRAAQLWVDANRSDEAARVLLVRGDGLLEPSARLQAYTQAAALAPASAPEGRRAREKRALVLLDLTREHGLSAVVRRSLLDAARELEQAGTLALAAQAYAVARDPDAQARALTALGDIDGLEALFSSEQAIAHREHRRHEAHAELDARLASGERRRACELAAAYLREQPDDETMRDRVASVRVRRAALPMTRIGLGGLELRVVMGLELVIGRGNEALCVSSPAVSRRHARIAREGPRVVIEDLGSRNGTQLRGVPIAGPLEVRDELELTLGRDVPLRLALRRQPPAGLDITLGGHAYVAPLGPARLGLGPWQLVAHDDGWIELATFDAPAFSGALELVSPVSLLVGDALAAIRDGPIVLRILS